MQSGLSGKQIYPLALSVACWAHQEDGGPVSGVRSSTSRPGNTWPHSSLALSPRRAQKLSGVLPPHPYVFEHDALRACNGRPGCLLPICPGGLHSSPFSQKAVWVALIRPLGGAPALGQWFPSMNARLLLHGLGVSSLSGMGLCLPLDCELPEGRSSAFHLRSARPPFPTTLSRPALPLLAPGPLGQYAL